MAQSLFERLGGAPSMNAAAEQLYKNIMVDDRINQFFQNIDMDHQTRKMAEFMTFAFGGAPNWAGKTLKDAHAGLVKNGLNDDHFDAVVENVKKTLDDLGVPADLAGEVTAIVEGGREDVLGRT